VRTHYPATVEEGIAITAQEAWTQRDGHKLYLPKFVQEVIERVAFVAREDKKIDKRSGVSQRLPISATENVISNAERRAIRNDEKTVVPRVSDIYAALSAITGKLELEYEGEMKGADHVSREIIRTAIAKTYDEYFSGVDMRQIVQWFDLGGEIQVTDSAGAKEVLEGVKGIQGLMEKLSALGVSAKDNVEAQVSAAEFVLEGLYAHKRIGRSEERVFAAGEKQPKKPEQRTYEREEPFRGRRPFN
jgi:magnesium chelatase subunit I